MVYTVARPRALYMPLPQQQVVAGAAASNSNTCQAANVAAGDGSGLPPTEGPGPPTEATGMDVDTAAVQGSTSAQDYTCPYCGGVVGIHRRAMHEQYWCAAAP